MTTRTPAAPSPPAGPGLLADLMAHTLDEDYGLLEHAFHVRRLDPQPPKAASP